MQVRRAELEFETHARPNVREVEYLVDHARHSIRTGLNLVDQFYVARRQPTVAQVLRGESNRGDRVSQVVADDGDQALAESGGLFGALALDLGGLEQVGIVHRMGRSARQLLGKRQVFRLEDSAAG